VTVEGDRASASIRSLVHCSVSQSMKTGSDRISARPSGDTRKATTSTVRLVTWTAAFPSASARQIWLEPPRADRK